MFLNIQTSSEGNSFSVGAGFGHIPGITGRFLSERLSASQEVVPKDCQVLPRAEGFIESEALSVKRL